MSYQINELKVALGFHIKENKKLSKEQKLSLIEFVKTATDLQVKHLALTGDVKHKFTTIESKNIEIQYKNSEILDEYKNIITEGTSKSLMAILFWGAIPWALWRLIRSSINKERKKCGVLSIGEKRDKCLQQVEILEKRKKIEAIQKAIPKCSGSTVPEKCKRAGTELLNKTKMELQKAQQRHKDSWGK